MKLRAPHRLAARQSGLTLVELMIAMTIGLLIIAGLTTTFVNSSRTRDEVERSNQRIENGRYAMQVLGDDLRMAGFFGELDLGPAILTPAAKPDPCSTDLVQIRLALPLHIQGYDKPSQATIAALTCLSDVKPGTDILVVRRTMSCVPGTANCQAAPVPNAPYFQASLCQTELAVVADSWRLDTPTGNLDRKKKNCATTAVIRQYFTHIYFIANNGSALDGIPTLKRAELGAGGFAIVPLAAGIENLQFEYGIDNDNDGIPDATNADPDTYSPTAPVPPACAGQDCVQNWRNVMSVKVNLLARNITTTSNFTDGKTYSLGRNADNSANTVTGADSYKRHVFQAEMRLNNPAGRR